MAHLNQHDLGVDARRTLPTWQHAYMQAADVTDITIDRQAMDLHLSFDDGVEGRIGLVELRLHCPCATCRAARQAGREAWPTRGGTDQSLELADAHLVGAWGLGITWNDGHATGIYPFSSLHDWIVAGHPVFSPDSGLGT
jgi:ATP-binding protein involved in chromosome partitioning